jgi:hypothetical protein
MEIFTVNSLKNTLLRTLRILLVGHDSMQPIEIKDSAIAIPSTANLIGCNESSHAACRAQLQQHSVNAIAQATLKRHS